MLTRILMGPVLIALLVGALLLDRFLEGTRLALAGDRALVLPGGTVLFLVGALLATWGARELAGILKDKGIEASKRILTLAALVGLLASCVVPSYLSAPDAAAVVSTAGVIVMLSALAYYSRDRNPQGIVAATGGVLLAFVYLGLMFGFYLAIRRHFSIWVVLWVLLVVKSCDIGAYFTGKAIGRHKLIPWLSPGKTWEGLIGGMIFAAIVATLGLRGVSALDVRPVPAPLWGVLVGLSFAVVGQAGDLIMSLFKRDAGLKDSGRSLPGFGGILDVLDSPLLVAPLAYWWLRASVGFA